VSMVCPHCGATLLSASDAFCPECRRDLDEPPDAPRAPEQVRAERSAGTIRVLRFFGILAILAGLSMAGTMRRGLVEDIVDLGFVIVGAGLLGVSYWLAHTTKTAGRPDRPQQPEKRNP